MVPSSARLEGENIIKNKAKKRSKTRSEQWFILKVQAKQKCLLIEIICIYFVKRIFKQKNLKF